MMIDTHAHIGVDEYEDIDQIFDEFKDNIVINAGTDAKRNIEVVELSKKYSNAYGVLGIHPEMADSYSDNDLDYIEQHLNNDKIVGIGEIGLDLYWRKDNFDAQKKLFIKQLELAKKYNKPVVIHSRETNKEIFDIIVNYPNIKKVMHCYSGDVYLAKKLIENNTLLGISGVVTYKNAHNLVGVVKEIPLEYLLIETDSPYLAPVPLRGTKNRPINVAKVALKIAEIKGISLEKVLETTSQNAIRQFDLKA